MRKILSFLVIFVLCAGCENYKADIDDYLSYWSTQAAIVRSGFDPAITVQTDTEYSFIKRCNGNIYRP